MGFSRYKYGSGLPSSPPGDLPDPGIKPTTLTSSALGGEFFTICASWEALISLFLCCFILCKYVHGGTKAEKQTHIRSIFFKKFASFNSLSIWSDILRFSVFCPEKNTVHIKCLNKYTRDCYMKYHKLSHSDKSLSLCVYIWTYPMKTTKHSDETKLFWCLLIWKHLAHRNSPGFVSRMPLPLLLFSNCTPPSQI